jgi:hypothetical protein
MLSGGSYPMSADVILSGKGAHAERIRIPGPGEQHLEAQVIILPCVRRTRPDPTRHRVSRDQTKGHAMKLTASITVETKDGDKMIPTSKDVGEIDGNTLRNIVHQTLCGCSTTRWCSGLARAARSLSSSRRDNSREP